MEDIIDYSKPLKNAKYERFCQEYKIDNNGKRAAIDAGYSKKTANVRASQLLAILSIKNRLAYLQAELSKASGVTAKRLMDELRKIGFANIKNYFRGGNKIKDISQLPDDLAAAIESVQITKAGGIRITLHNKLKSIEDMGRHIGFFEQDNTQKVAAAPTIIVHDPNGKE